MELGKPLPPNPKPKWFRAWDRLWMRVFSTQSRCMPSAENMVSAYTPDRKLRGRLVRTRQNRGTPKLDLAFLLSSPVPQRKTYGIPDFSLPHPTEKKINLNWQSKGGWLKPVNRRNMGSFDKRESTNLVIMALRETYYI